MVPPRGTAGHLEAQFFLGAAHARGRGVGQDDQEAIQWFTKAAQGGHTGAQYELGLAYSTGRGVAQNERVALDWFEKAATLGHPEAQYFAGQSYTNGWGTSVDHAWAARWYGKAAEQGLAKAQYMLGVAYAAGLGLPRDPVAAHTWLSLAAKQDDAEAVRLRDAVARKMNQSEIAQANARARQWRAAAPTRFADAPTVRFAQVRLAAFGFDPGPADGQVGSRTRQAIAAYQAKVGLRGDAAVTPALLERLRADGGASLTTTAR
jgi:localization factor PodJL